MSAFNETVVEQTALDWLESLGYYILSGPEITPEEPLAERQDYSQVVLERRVRQALQRLNPKVPEEALEEALRKLVNPETPSPISNTHIFHKYLRYDITTKNMPIRIAERPVGEYDFRGNQGERY